MPTAHRSAKDDTGHVPPRRAALFACAAALLAAGCGQRGPLYLPENAPPRRPPPAPQAEPEESRR